MKKYIITTAVPGAVPHKQFLKTLQNYCKRNNAKLLIIPSANIYKEDVIHVTLVPYLHQFDKNLNENIKISMMPINPESVDPVAGLERTVQIDSSVIFASPKQRLKSVASPRYDTPRVVMTPGACTRPYNNPDRVVSRRSVLAQLDHVIGAIIVEIESNKMYHYRQVQADLSGRFIDLGVQYSPTGKVRKIKPEALIPGDYHVGWTDPRVKRVIIEILKKLDPKYLVLHDFFDGISVNHHIENKILERASLGDKASLKAELELAAAELKELSSIARNTLVVKSNHDEFLDRWLTEARYINDQRNYLIGLELSLAKARGSDPLEFALRNTHSYKNVTFLKDDESFKITERDIELAVHGHRGPNGSRGSASSLEKSYGEIVFGHTHTPEILRGAWVVGTSTFLKLSYNVGSSSWMNTMCLVYPNGSRQLINVINGRYRV